jgi:hypothetical protein
MEKFTDVKLEIFVPQAYALRIRDELATLGVGRMGFSARCQARSHLMEKLGRSKKRKNIKWK